MRKFLQFFCIALVVGLYSQVNAQQYMFPENGKKRGFELMHSSRNAINLKYRTNDFQLADVKAEGVDMKQLIYNAIQIPTEAGSPDLPVIGQYVMLENGAKANITVNRGEKVVYKNVLIAPASEIPFDTEKEIPPVRGKQYQKNAFFPANPFQVKMTEVRGITLAHIDITPFQYNPVTKELIVYKELDIQLTSNGGNGYYVEDRFRSRSWDPILSDMIINYNDLPKKYKRSAKTEEGCEYLIVVPDNEDFLPWADSIKRFRNEQGISTKVVKMSEIGENTVANINQYFEDVYKNWSPVPSAVLLMADYGNDDNTITAKSYPHPYMETYITDNFYADVTGNDLPDMVFARMTGNNATQFETMVKKFMTYERTPPTDADFYNHPITALGWQTERWFQICSEVVGGYFKHVKGKDPVRINAVYQGDPNMGIWSTAENTNAVVEYFGESGLEYIPNDPGELGDWENGNADDVVDAINDGGFMLQHRDHGAESGWGEPDFRLSNIDELTNADKLIHIFSINCLTGRFDYDSECFAEKFHRKQNGGALSITAASQVSYSFVNDAFVWGMFDNMFPDFMPDNFQTEVDERDFRPAFGAASGKYFLSQNDWAYNVDAKKITYDLFHHHGDAFGMVYSEVPQELNVNIPEEISADQTSISVSANQGALIAVSKDGVLLNSVIATGTNQSISIPQQIPDTHIKVVITKQNYFRDENFINIVANEGSFITLNDSEVNDSEGNNNGLIENGETFLLDITIANYGDEASANIETTISTESTIVDILDNEATSNALTPMETRTIEGAFKLKAHEGIADQTPFTIKYTFTEGDKTTETEVTYEVVASHIEVVSYNIEETSGNGDGFVDAGETAAFTVVLKNVGNCASTEGVITLNNQENKFSFSPNNMDIPVIAKDGEETYTFELSIDATVANGSIFTTPLEYDNGQQQMTKIIEICVGKNIESFESGDFSALDWQLEGNAEWTVVDSEHYEGTYAAQSGSIDDYEKSTLMITQKFSLSSNPISFYIKTSSENTYDFLFFYIDGEKMGEWSGTTNWTKIEHSVPAGEHTLKWIYEKDGSQTGGSDQVWVDMISLPITNDVMVVAGENGKISAACPTYTTNPTIYNVDSFSWATDGDGTFSDPNEAITTYTAGPNDLTRDKVTLTLNAVQVGNPYSSSLDLQVLNTLLYYDSHNINDKEGNDNGSFEMNELINIDFGIENIGHLPNDNVTATIACDNSNIQIINGTTNYGTIAAGEVKNIEDAFQIKTLEGFENNEEVVLTVSFNDGSFTSEKEITFNVKTPVPTIAGIKYTNATNGQEGFLEPGQTYHMDIELENTGGAIMQAGVISVENIANKINFAETSKNVGTINPSGDRTVTFEFTVDENATSGEVILIPIKYETPLVNLQEDVKMTIGSISDNFESANFEFLEWEMEGDADWTIDTENAYEGEFCIKSGAISHEETSTLKITRTYTSTSLVSFYVKISSEESFDNLKFYIDDNFKIQWNGVSDWVKYSCVIEEGVHTFKWSYVKDNAESQNEDCAWLDMISFPISNDIQFFAGYPEDVCSILREYNTLPIIQDATNLSWTTDGDGTFSNPNQAITLYTAGDEEIQNIGGKITLTLSGEIDGNPVESKVQLNVYLCDGVNELESANKHIVPNPANTAFSIEGMELSDEAVVLIYDAMGHLVEHHTLENNEKKIAVSHLDDGVYMIQINDQQNNFTQKLVVKH